MKLPSIEQKDKNKHSSIIKEKFKIIKENNYQSPTFKSNSFINKMKEIKEVKIYLKEKFIKTEIDESFLKDIEKEYAEQFLLKMKIFPTKNLIQKILKNCPLKDCDFQLYDETIFINYREKNVKSLHIFPVFERKRKKVNDLQSHNFSIKTEKNNFSRNDISVLANNKTLTYRNKNFGKLKNNTFGKEYKKNYKHLSIETTPSNKNYFETLNNFSSKNNNDILNIYRFNSIDSHNNNEEFLYNREKIDDLFVKYKENVSNLQLFSNKKSIVKVDLSPENIRNKYIYSESNWSNKIYENKGKLSKISKSILSYKNILNNEKYFFDLRKIENLNSDIIQEIKEPINPQLELIIKDINYILDNFPFDEFIYIKKDEQLIKGSKEINEINNNFNLNKIVLNNKKEFLGILKIISSNDSCRIIILCINLIYWIIFGGNNQIQIDKNTKELIYLKLMKEWELLSSKFINKTIFFKIYVPLFIIICRIEIENCFLRKYTHLLEDKKNKLFFLKKANAIISEIFDKHGYMNTFNLFCQKKDENNKKFKISIGHYKNKLYATSNFLETLFKNEDDNLKNENEIKERENYIIQYKKKYFSFYLDKMNNHLKRRNLEPIFKTKYKTNEQKEELNIINIKSEEYDNNLDDKKTTFE